MEQFILFACTLTGAVGSIPVIAVLRKIQHNRMTGMIHAKKSARRR